MLHLESAPVSIETKTIEAKMWPCSFCKQGKNYRARLLATSIIVQCGQHALPVRFLTEPHNRNSLAYFHLR
jgi:hypothetical protein